ncbi:MAG: SLBB domain-containing protein [Ignavibacteria bacterium]|nr:SLBB domain-containing protein [Ignavibacteria bacterium]
MRLFVFLSIIAFSCSGFVFGQMTGLPVLQKDLFDEQIRMRSGTEIPTQLEKYPVSSVVDENYYYIGPNDYLSVMIFPSIVEPEIVKVTPENKVILSRIGEVDLSGKTLKEAKRLIIEKAKQINPNAEVFVSLYHPRTVVVQISGYVDKPGVYFLPANFRISDAISFAMFKETTSNASAKAFETENYIHEMNRLREETMLKYGIPSDIFYSTRNINVFNPKYGLRKVDVELSRSRDLFFFDPYIREGDEISVPFPPLEFEYVTISGAVVRPGKYFYKLGDKVSDLIKFSKGFKESADLKNSYIVFSNGEKRWFSLDSLMNPNEDFLLEPYSYVVIGEKEPSIKGKIGIAGVFGVVEKPGIYPIEIGKTRLLDLINLAGGIVGIPSYSQAFVLRNFDAKRIWDNPTRSYQEFLRISNLTMEDTTRFKMNLLTKNEFVSCDFYSLLVGKDASQNIFLDDGYLVVLPPATRKVYVWGQVRNPGYVTYAEGKKVDYYIREAGGLLSHAQKGRISIVRGPQKAWLEPSETVVLDGDEIYVPRPPDYPPGIDIQYYSMIATGIATLISLTYLIINLLTRRN